MSTFDNVSKSESPLMQRVKAIIIQADHAKSEGNMDECVALLIQAARDIEQTAEQLAQE